VRAPGEREALERSWQVARGAFERREPARPRRRTPRRVLVVVVAAAVLAGVLTPPGRALLDGIRKAVGVQQARPRLFSLPAPGRVLAVSAGGAWIVSDDGSRRRLGSYDDAAWSPFGRFVVVTDGSEISALTAEGTVRWALARRGARLPAWGGTRADTRIAYLAGTRLRVVGGDGTGDVDAGGTTAAAVRPAWRPGARHVLAYADTRGRVVAYEPDAGSVRWRSAALPRPRALAWSQDGRMLLALGARELRLYDAAGYLVVRRPLAAEALAAAFAPRSHGVAVLLAGGRVLVGGRTVFAAGSPLRGLAWSPDGRWLLLSWPGADQWVFVRVRPSRRIEAVSHVASQLDGWARLRGWGPREPAGP
jgi:hypothetical protein